MLSCAFICLTVKHRVGYWCMWVVWFVFELLLKYFIVGTIGISATSVSMSVCRVILYIILFLVTMRVFDNLPPPHKRKRILPITWIIYLTLSVLPIAVLHMMAEVTPMVMLVFYVIPSAIPILSTPFLFISTVRYLKSRKQDRK